MKLQKTHISHGVKGYFFTTERLNDFVANIVKETIKNAAESKCTHVKVDLDGNRIYSTGLCVESITNTFEETFKKFKV
jgi:hypothetical protein